MSGACSTRGRDENVKGRYYLGDLGMDGMLIKLILKKLCLGVITEFIWHKTWPSGGLL
jgi:hypothetical protein